MGRDKGLISWHGKPQRLYLYDLMKELGMPAFFSCREEQAAFLKDYPCILDATPGAGPANALLDAHKRHPGVAWLVLACDMPLIDVATLRFLINKRDENFMATAFRAPYFDDGSPDPLCSIWEPKAFDVLAARLQEGKRCLRKTLMSMPLNMLEPPNPAVLKNINTPEELNELMQEKQDLNDA
ncbi:MAG: NTP transferase domain-containing protein [Saprospiraceae bacterium]|nr:NTP transferase domain-containing protein [Saprospiraceae bacterium]